MAYRRTPRVQERLAATRERIADVAEARVARSGWAGVTVAAVAREARVATGTLYRHFADKDALCAEVFRRAAGRELARVEDAVGEAAGGAAGCCEVGLRTFAERALRGRVMAYALLAEPASPAVEEERLAYRRGYRSLFRDVIAEGARSGELGPCDPDVLAAVVVGAAGEALVGPLAPAHSVDGGARARLVDDLVRACIRALPWRADSLADPPADPARDPLAR